MTQTKAAGTSGQRQPANIQPDDIPTIAWIPARGALTRREFFWVLVGRPIFIAIVLAELMHLDAVSRVFARIKIRYDRWRHKR